VLLGVLTAVLARYGPAGFYRLQGPADAASVELKFAVFGFWWGLIGTGLLAATIAPESLRTHRLFAVVLAFLAFQYLSVLRGPHAIIVGDFSNYFLAAVDMRHHVPLDQSIGRQYLYPPLLATLLEPMVPFGLSMASNLFRLANYFWVLVLALQLYALLPRYGFSRELAALTVAALLVADVPVLDSLINQQINLVVLNLMLGAVLAYPSHPAGSALTLALATHLKVYPALLVLPFLMRRDWRWIGWTVASHVGVVCLTSSINGFDYYRQFLQTLGGLREPGLRNVSFDSLVFNTFRLLAPGLAPPGAPLGAALRLGAGGLALWAMWPALHRKDLVATPAEQAPVLLGLVTLPVIMLLVSPSVWPHHFVLVLTSFAAAPALARDSKDLWGWAAAAATILWYPVNEIYPVSYLRLAGLVVMALLLARAARRPAGPSPWFDALNARARVLAGPSGAMSGGAQTTVPLPRAE
jgi:glycosyl transferase family 87